VLVLVLVLVLVVVRVHGRKAWISTILRQSLALKCIFCVLC